MKAFEETQEKSGSVYAAIRKCILVIVQTRSHNPLLITRLTGYSLDLTSATVWLLLNSPAWTDRADTYP
jgi:hypothetical protein